MSIGRAVASVAACTVVFSFFGATAGYLLGKLMPGYYRSVFYGGDSPSFDPVQVGVGQGLTQGAVGGAVIGLILVALVAWHGNRSGK
jgi:hypothetical protein